MTPWKRRQRLEYVLFFYFFCYSISFYRLSETAESEKLLSPEENTSSNNIEQGSQPNTDFQIRNRYLSRIGAPVSTSDLGE